MKLTSQNFLYDDSWPIVALAFFIRYPNPYASHVVSCDVINRSFTSSGTLKTTRLLLKRGVLPHWFPTGIVSRAESWVVEESEVDIDGRTVRCVTKNLDHVKVMQVVESTTLRQADDGKTLQTTNAEVISQFGWGLTKRIEKYGVYKFKKNVEKSRQGISLVLSLLRESRLQPIGIGPSSRFSYAFSSHPLGQSVSGDSIRLAHNAEMDRGITGSCGRMSELKATMK